ncbi:cytochrome c oxidase accessory protein CcoG [Alteromonadales bacterium alter-6D02]|nr:cytochrome c oxidase accessory protein CcoG [Alteromonadales bacterium alter-6D02]
MSVIIDPKDLIIAPDSNQSSAIYVREQQGKYQRIRRNIAIVLMTLFAILPWLTVGGEQAILIDLTALQLHVFGATLFPQDFPIVAGFFMVAAFALFFVTTWLGRVWCGFLCPQTHWLFIFVWLEEKIEGSRNQRIKLDKQAMSLAKTTKKTLKHLSWGIVSFLTATTFLTYFVPPITLYSDLVSWQWSGLITFWVAFFAVCTYGNAGWLREKMCLHMCPYARFQSVMFDHDTYVVAYDTQRGESRGPRKRKQDPKELGLGDCIDCNLCVEVCPVGIDIRHGLQYECISCGACADACDQTMSRFNYPEKLISFTSEAQLAGGITHLFRAKIIGYAIACVLIVVAMGVYWGARVPAELSVLRDRNVLYRVNNDDLIENSFQLKILNKLPYATSFQVSAAGIDGIHVSITEPVMVQSGELTSQALTLTADPEDIKLKVTPITLTITSEGQEPVIITQESRFFSE